MNAHESSASTKSARLSFHAKPGAMNKTDTSGLGFAPSTLHLQQILVPTDFSEPSEKALRYAGKLAEQFGSAVTLLHVLQPVVYPADFGYPSVPLDVDEGVRDRIQKRLADIAQQLSFQGQPLIRVGQPYQEIGRAAAEINADLIIVATHGHTGLKHVLLGSTAERVARHAPCPVLIVRERERDFI